MTSLTKKKVEEFHRNGFIKIPKFLNEKNTKKIKQDLEIFLQRYQKKLSARQINFTKNKKINSVHDLTKWKWISELQNSKSIRTIAKKIIGEKIENFGAELFYKPKRTGLSVPTHQDNYYWCLNNPNAITIWIALDKANKENGGIYYYKKSHLLGLLEHIPSNVPGSSQKLKFPMGLDAFSKVYPSLKPGDCLIHHSLIAHGSLSNTSNSSRVGITLRYKSKKSQKDKFLLKRYERELKEQIKLRNN